MKLTRFFNAAFDVVVMAASAGGLTALSQNPDCPALRFFSSHSDRPAP
jgi:hypothetical protein